MIERISNESLEQQIASIYWRAHEEAPGVRIQERGVLLELWTEFEARVAEGRIEIE